MKPTVGRIVHYTNLGDREGVYPPEIQAALITKVVPSPIKCLHVSCLNAGIQATHESVMGDHLCGSHAQTSEDRTRCLPEEAHFQVSLHVFYPTGDFKMDRVVFTEADAGSEPARGMWTWPARVGLAADESARSSGAQLQYNAASKRLEARPARDHLVAMCTHLKESYEPWKWLGEHDGRNNDLRDDVEELLGKMIKDAFHAQRYASYCSGWLKGAKEAGHLGDLELPRGI